MLQENQNTASATPTAVEYWESSSEEGAVMFQNEEEVSDSEVNPMIIKTVHFICTFLLSWQAIFRLTDTALNVLFRFSVYCFLSLV